MDFLAEWGLEILFALVSGGVIGFFKFKTDKLKKKVQEYEELKDEERKRQTEQCIETKLEPIYEELEDLRAYIRDTQNIEKAHMNLIIASYRFRLIQLCKAFIKQGYMTYSQYEQLTEFYKLYVGLGGNGQAKGFYDRAIQLPIKESDD